MLEKNDEWVLLELFFKEPLHPFHLRELCRALKWSPTKVRSKISSLKKKVLITETKEKNLSIFRANIGGDEYKKFKIVHNILKAFDIAKIIERNLEDFEAIILFGSARKGEDMENSDFDICIVGAKEREIDFKETEKELGRKISLLFIDSFEKLRKNNRELLNNLINGFVIKGYAKVFE